MGSVGVDAAGSAMQASDSSEVLSQYLTSGIIGLREGLECGIVVTILVAFLVKSGRRDALRWVWLGVAAAIAMTLLIFVTIQYGSYTISDLGAEAIAGVASLVAVVIVTTMVLWMRTAAASIAGELRAGLSKALESGALAVLALSFLAVGREGAETALLMVGYAESSSMHPVFGLIIGVLLAALLSYAMYRGAVRINLSKFFKYTGAFLVVVAAGILSYGIGALQTAGWLPFLTHKAFDISRWFDWSAWYGEVIRGILNITPTPTVLQLLCWAVYLAVVLSLFLKPVTSPAKPSTPESSDTASEPERSAS